MVFSNIFWTRGFDEVIIKGFILLVWLFKWEKNWVEILKLVLHNAKI